MSNYLNYNKGKSLVWDYFLREISGNSAKCIKCDKILQVKGGSTKGLFGHLKGKHEINLIKRNNGEDKELQVGENQSIKNLTPGNFL